MPAPTTVGRHTEFDIDSEVLVSPEVIHDSLSLFAIDHVGVKEPADGNSGTEAMIRRTRYKSEVARGQ